MRIDRMFSLTREVLSAGPRMVIAAAAAVAITEKREKKAVRLGFGVEE